MKLQEGLFLGSLLLAVMSSCGEQPQEPIEVQKAEITSAWPKQKEAKIFVIYDYVAKHKQCEYRPIEIEIQDVEADEIEWWISLYLNNSYYKNQVKDWSVNINKQDRNLVIHLNGSDRFKTKNDKAIFLEALRLTLAHNSDYHLNEIVLN